MPSVELSMPSRVLTDQRLEVTDSVVLAYLSSLRDSEGWAWPANETIARDLRLTIDSVSSGIERLIRAGWVDTKAEAGRVKYRINWYGEGGGSGSLPPLPCSSGTPLPDGFPFSDNKQIGQSFYPDIDIEAQARRFRSHHSRLESKRNNWHAAWMAWLRAEEKYSAKQPVDAATSVFDRAAAQFAGDP